MQDLHPSSSGRAQGWFGRAQEWLWHGRRPDEGARRGPQFAREGAEGVQEWFWRTHHVNLRAAIALAVLVAAGVALVLGLGAYQRARFGRVVIAQARHLDDQGQTGLAVQHLTQYLEGNPDDLDALELEASLLAKSATTFNQVEGAIRVLDQLVRRDPDGPGRQETRRKLAELYIRHADIVRDSALFSIAPEMAGKDLRYGVAAQIAEQLVARGADDPEALRIWAMANEGLAAPGNQAALDKAIELYERVLKADPGDVTAAGRLARLYKDRKGDTAKSDKVMERLVAARPRDVEARLACYRYLADMRRHERARAELDEAIRLDPHDPATRLIAAELDAREGDLEGARAHLKEIPPAARDIRVYAMKGRIDFVEEHPDRAVVDLRDGLMASGGTDAGLTFQLAFALLQMGHIAEARPLVDQLLRLVGDDTAPAPVLLLALMDLKMGRTERALRRLERVEGRVGGAIREQFLVALAECHEGLWNEKKAEETFRQAIAVAPHSAAPRLGVARLLVRRRPNEAIAELQQGLGEVDDPRPLWLALLRALLIEQEDRTAEQRSWAAFDRTAEAAAAAMRDGRSLRDGPSFAMLQADRLALGGKPEEAIARLEEAVEKYPEAADLWLSLANGLVLMRRPDEALKALERASRPDKAGDVAGLRIARARLLLARGHGRQARDLLSRDVDRLPLSDRPLVWRALAELLASQGDVTRARRAFAEWSRLLPDDPRPKLATLKLALDHHDRALAQAVVDQLRGAGEAGEVPGLVAQAMMHLHSPGARAPASDLPSPELRQAEALLASALKMADGLPVAYFLMGRVEERQGRIDEAIKSYRNAWDRGEQDALPRLVELLFRRKQFDEIAKLEGDVTGSQLDRLSADLALRAGDADQADRFIEQAIKAQPEAAGPRTWRARLLIESGRYEDAEAALRALAESQPRNIEYWLSLLRFQSSRKRTEAAASTAAEIRERFDAEDPGLLEARCAWAVGDRARADRAFAETIRRHPGNVPALLLAAKYYEETARPAEAEAHLRDALGRDPKSRAAALQLASLLSARAGDLAAWERAWEVLGPESDAEDADDRLFRAVVLSRCPDPARRAGAIVILEALVADLPPGAEAAAPPRDLLISLLLREGRAERASELAGSAAGLEDDPALIARYAETLLAARAWDAAEQQLDHLAELSPGDGREARLRADLAQGRARPEEAVAALEKTVADRGDRPGAEALGREACLRLLELGPPAEAAAERLGRLLAERYPASSWLLARSLARRGRLDEAYGLCRAAVRAGSPADRLEAAQVALETVGRDGPVRADPTAIDGALSVVEAARQGDPEDASLLSALAVLQHARGDYREEARLYREALDRDPGSAVVANNLALALSEGIGRPAEGLKLIDALIDREGRDPALLDTRGVILTRLGRLDEAIKDLEDVARARPNGLHHYHLARAYLKAGKTESFRQARELMRRDGLTPEGVDPMERAEVASLLQQ
jgi:tetratricopeptide (TPR) repeat protein